MTDRLFCGLILSIFVAGNSLWGCKPANQNIAGTQSVSGYPEGNSSAELAERVTLRVDRDARPNRLVMRAVSRDNSTRNMDVPYLCFVAGMLDNAKKEKRGQGTACTNTYLTAVATQNREYTFSEADSKRSDGCDFEALHLRASQIVDDFSLREQDHPTFTAGWWQTDCEKIINQGTPTRP